MNKEDRQQKGIEIASLYNLSKQKGAWLVPSSKGNRSYRVTIIGKNHFCTCLDFETHGTKCKHIFAVEHARKNKRPVGRPPKKTIELVVEKRKTYPQQWSAYNLAQTKEKDLFQKLLFDLCKDVKEIDPGRGRPRLPISDSIFSAVFKIYSTVSARRFMCDLSDAKEKRLISQVSHFNTIFNYLENPALSGILTELIQVSSLPLRDIEEDFAADSTGFGSSRHTRWFDHKYGKVAVQQDWIKAHIMCGVHSNIVTAVEIHEERTHDAPIFPLLLNTTAKNFRIREVSGDKGYTSANNMQAVKNSGGTPYFAFKSNATGLKGGIWDKMFYRFSLHRENYLKHYHKRSNVETTIHMIKSKFGDHVRSKSDIAMKNEVLCKVLCHNICCLVQAIYELGIEVDFAESLKDAA